MGRSGREVLFGSRIAGLLRRRGWEAHQLGADVPAEDLAAFAAAPRAQLVALSVTLADHLDSAAETAAHLDGYLRRIGARMQRLRRERGLSQAALAAASGLARSHLSAVEAGRQNITLDAALRLARGLGSSMEELLDERPDPS